MAAPIKQGLDYFSLDVDFFSNEKVEAISGEFGIKGEIFVLRLLCVIYRNGYYCLWSEMLKMKMLKNMPGISDELIERMISRLVKWGFFDENLFNSVKVLTSTGIQKRYAEATKRRKEVDTSMYWLLPEKKDVNDHPEEPPKINVDINPVNVNINQKEAVNVDINPVNVNINSQSKVKESKGNVLRESGEESPPAPEQKYENQKPEVSAKQTPQELMDKRRIAFIDGLAAYTETYGNDMINDFYRYWTEPNKSKTKMRWELEPTWDVNRRLITWASRQKTFQRN